MFRVGACTSPNHATYATYDCNARLCTISAGSAAILVSVVTHFSTWVYILLGGAAIGGYSDAKADLKEGRRQALLPAMLVRVLAACSCNLS